jgi:ribonuclease Z
MRLAALGLSPVDLDAVFVTHHHSDHVSGLEDLVMSRWIMDRLDEMAPLPVRAPTGPATDFLDKMLDPWEHDLEVRSAHTGRGTRPGVDVMPFQTADSLVEVWSEGDVRVVAGPVRHEPVVPAVGYRVETPHGAVAISGDTLVCSEMAALAEGVDVLIYEAMRFDLIRARPEYLHFVLDYHADTVRIGAQAQELGVPVLMLTHLIPEPITEEDRQGFVDDVRRGGYTGEVMVAEDLTTVNLG